MFDSETDGDAVKDLRRLMSDESWYTDDDKHEVNEEIQQLSRTHPKIFRQTSSTHQFLDEHQSFPLMMLCGPPCIVNVSLETIFAACNAHPAALHIPGRFGDLPIHRACASGASVDIVKFLYQKYPESSLIRGAYGRTPLHMACGSGGIRPINTRNVIGCLIECCPKAAFEPCNNGDLPLHTVLTNQVMSSKYRVETLRDLLRVAPSTVSAKDSFRILPLELLLKDTSFSNDTKFSLVQEFLEAYPQAATAVVHVSCLWGERKPWNTLQAVLGYHLRETMGKSLDYPSRYPLHAIMHVYKLSSNSFFLIDAIYKFRHELKRLDDCDKLPLHIALERCEKWDSFPRLRSTRCLLWADELRWSVTLRPVCTLS